jgi:Zn-dependent protease with chaperone function
VNEDKSTRYQRLKRQASVVSLAAGILVLAGLVWTGGHIALRDAAERIAPSSLPWRAGAIVFLYVVFLSLVNEIVTLPIGFYSGFILERRYNLSTENLGGWLRDQAKSLAIGVALGGAAAEVVYWCIRRSPDQWWAAAGVLFTLAIVGLTNLAPVLLLPLFFTVKPLDREALRTRLLALAQRAGARVVGAYEWGLGGKTRKANAALAGLGGTRRILVSDTMLTDYSDEEIEVVLAHELAHHVHGDIWKGIALESVLIIGGFYVASRVLPAVGGAAGLRGVDDVAGLPLLLLAAGAVSVVMLPAANAMSRALERRADRFALALTRNPVAFISAMRRLGAQNLAEEHPSRLVQWLFYSHPPMRDRIAAAEEVRNTKLEVRGAGPSNF